MTYCNMSSYHSTQLYVQQGAVLLLCCSFSITSVSSRGLNSTKHDTILIPDHWKQETKSRNQTWQDWHQVGECWEASYFSSPSFSLAGPTTIMVSVVSIMLLCDIWLLPRHCNNQNLWSSSYKWTSMNVQFTI